MKKILITLIVFLPLLCLGGCSKDDDKSTDPVDLLPPATQTGAGTFGCMINGKAFIPSGIGLGGPILDCVYQLVDGEYYFALKAKGKKNNELKTVGILTEQMEIEENKSYILTQKKENNASGAYWYSPKYIYIYTSQDHNGILNITKLDKDNNIVSGTFWFDILLPNGKIVEIREGRFDMRFTQ